MMKETDSIYAYKVEHAKDFSFQTMMALARNFVRSLDESQSNELFEKLNRGVDLLSSEPLMNMYLYAFGNMHEAKLKLAFENMGEDYKQMDDFAIIDYGCGQGLASIVLYDHLKVLGLEKNVHKVVLIEPSEAALKRAALHVSTAFPNADIVTINKFLDDVTITDISCNNQMAFHLFSNILDVESVSIDHLAELVNNNESPNKTIVCVSPNFGGNFRNNRIDAFCSKLNAEEYFSCAKTKGEWIKEWSCKINVLEKTEPKEFLFTGVTEEDLAEAWEDEFGVKYSKDGKKLLKGNDCLHEYNIKNGTKVICNSAFNWCKSLQSITIPNSVTSIGDEAFKVCESLQNITIPNSVTSIGDEAFRVCESLQSITIPNSVTNIGDGVFGNCILYVELDSSQFFSDGICLIDMSSHRLLSCHRKDLKNYSIPNSVTSIGKGAFSWCQSLQSINIPNSVKSIGEEAFRVCESLQSINIPNSVIRIEENAFDGCKSLQNINIPDSVTSIGECAFQDCISLQSISIPGSVTSIRGGVFSGCKSLQDVNIPNSVTSIGECAFQNCISLQSITIPNSVENIEAEAFEGCNLRIKVDSSQFFSDGNCLIDLSSHILLGCHRCGLMEYIIPDSVISIGECAFADCSSLQSITIPNSVTSIRDYAFSGCKSLQSVNIPNSVTTIGDSAFWDSSLQSITIPNSVTSIGKDAFWNCLSLQSIIIPNSVTSIEPFTFMNCSSLENITIPISVTSIDDGAFIGCSSLVCIIIPISVTSIGAAAFRKCSSLEYVFIPNSVTSIGNKVFLECGSLRHIFIQSTTRSKFEKMLPEYKDKLVEIDN